MTVDQALKERLVNLTQLGLFGILRDFFLNPLLYNMDQRFKTLHTVMETPDGLFVRTFHRPVIIVELTHMTISCEEEYGDYVNAIISYFAEKCNMTLSKV